MRGQKATNLIVRVQYWKARKLVRGQDIAGAQQSFQSGATGLNYQLTTKGRGHDSQKAF